MEMMSSSTAEPIDLLSLKLLPAWVKEHEARSYEHYAGEEERRELRGPQRPPRNKHEGRTSDFQSGDGPIRRGEHSTSKANKKQPRGLRKKTDRREHRPEIKQSDPIKGNFSNVSRCRLSETLLGPTNHHNYQPQLRSLYEQRFSRRMSFADYQRQIEIVNDPALIEQWKEQARTVTTFTSLNGEASSTFSSASEAERHFRSNHLPGLLRSVDEVTISGGLSRRLPDRTLNRALEDAWTRETHSPSNMMQALAGRFRQAGLNVFRHRRGMLFVSPIRVRPFVHDQAGVCPLVNAILEALAATPGISRKELFEKVITDPANEEAESCKLTLACDVRWLINEGYVIEFNDGSLDLPRGKAKPQEISAAVVSTAETGEQALTGASASTAPAGGNASEELVDSESPPS